MPTRALAAALIATGVFLLLAPAAGAAPTEIGVRIEGKAKTLFEGPVLTDGREIRAASDRTSRPCDGTNGGANPSPGPTPTAAAVDAISIAGGDFDGRWFAGHDDYYVTRWGPDAESFEGAGAFWGVLVGGTLTAVGGCQLQLEGGEEVLWAHDAFNPSRPFLRLASEDGGATDAVYVERGEELELRVEKRLHGGVLGVSPTVEPAAGVPVRSVSTEPGTRFQAPGQARDVSRADGHAAVAFDTAGWQRLKATDDSAYIRSNRLDVCVRPAGGGGCGPLPPDAVLRVPPPPPAPVSGAGDEQAGGSGGAPRPAPSYRARGTLDRSVRFLQNAQNRDGGFGAESGEASDPVFSAWAAYALAAAGINPQDQSKPGGVDVHTYLTRRTSGLRQTTDFDRVALVALAAGTSPREFGGVDAIGAILSRQLADGSFAQTRAGSEGWVNATVWSIFPLSALKAPAAKAAVRRATRWLLGRQRPDGSWPSYSPGSGSDVDMTGAAIQALNAAGRHGTAAQARAFGYLRAAQGADGGFATAPGGDSNAASTAWATQAIWSAGTDPRAWPTGAGQDPLAYLASLQRRDGSIGYTASSDLNSLWMTAQAGPALAGRAYPLPAVPRQAAAERPRAPRVAVEADALPAAARAGDGGKRSQPGEGVIAGGGGRGAPLFSAPQPQSAGDTPRGGRDLRAPAAGSQVEGVLLAGQSRPTAPGLLGAGRGGDPEPLEALLLVGAIGIAAAFGFRRGRLEAA